MVPARFDMNGSPVRSKGSFLSTVLQGRSMFNAPFRLSANPSQGPAGRTKAGLSPIDRRAARRSRGSGDPAWAWVGQARKMASSFARFSSRQDDSPAMKAVAAMRNQFGGHAVQAGGPPTTADVDSPADNTAVDK